MTILKGKYNMNNVSPITVGFIFYTDGSSWHGGRNYFNSLFLALSAQVSSLVRPVVFIGQRSNAEEFDFPPNVNVVQHEVFDQRSFKWNLNKLAERLFGRPLISNYVLRMHGCNILSHSAPSGDTKIPTACWIPDFQHIHLPQFFKPSELIKRDQTFRRYLINSEIVIVSSESARKDLERFAPDSAEKVRVLKFCAILPDMESANSVNVRKLYNLHGCFFYIPNQFWAHKNHITAIRALAKLHKKRPDVKIICSGVLKDHRNPYHLDSLLSEIRLLGLEDQFILLGVIPYEHITPLMLQSVAVINPSLFEGWSTTVEEAKAIGTPLILSDIDVHREQCVNGEATFFPPNNSDLLAVLMEDKLSLQIPDAKTRSQSLINYRLKCLDFVRSYESIINEIYVK